MQLSVKNAGAALSSISIMGVLIAIAAVLLPADLTSATFWGLRLAVLAFAIFLMVWSYYKGPHELLISPLLILCLIEIVFFSILPIFFETTPGILNYGVEIHNMVQAVLKGDGDRLIVQNAALCLACAALVGVFAPQAKTSFHFKTGTWKICLGAIVGIVCVMGMFFLARGLEGQYAILRYRITADVMVALPPLLSLSSAGLTYIAAKSGSLSKRGIFLGVVLAAMGAQVVLGSPKLSIITTVSCLCLFLLVAPKKNKYVAAYALLALLLPFAGLTGMSILRYQDITIGVQSIDTLPAALERVFTAKVVNRQGVTAYCFNKIVERNLYASTDHSPYYFLAGLIPSYVWPEKPSLSIGVEIAKEYCGHEVSPLNPDTAVGTLLGEPIMRAGLPGLIVAETVLLLCLSGLTILGLRGKVGLIYLAALIPWLVDFDQHFAMYVANAVKVSIFMLPGIWLLNRNSYTLPPTSAP